MTNPTYDYVTKYIFEPLGMKDTTYILTPEIEKRIVSSARRWSLIF